jgi:hypothetical protein
MGWIPKLKYAHILAVTNSYIDLHLLPPSDTDDPEPDQILCSARRRHIVSVLSFIHQLLGSKDASKLVSDRNKAVLLVESTLQTICWCVATLEDSIVIFQTPEPL